MLRNDDSRLEKWNADQLTELENHISVCVQRIMDCFKEECDDALGQESIFEPNKQEILRMVQIFRESYLFYKESNVNIEKELDQYLEYMSYTNPVDVMKVLHPVLCYALLMKNEVNPNVVKSRIKRGTDRWGNTKNIFHIPDFDELSSRKESAVDKLRDKLREQKEIVMNSAHGDYSKKRFLEIIEQAEDFLDYDLIVQIEAIAKTGLFVRSFFYPYDDSSEPVDSILCLYIIDKLNEIVYLAGDLCNASLKGFQRGKIITQYCSDQGISVEELLMRRVNGFIDKDTEKADVTFPLTSNDLDSFSATYMKLCSANVVSLKDVRNIFDYYFDEKKLSWYSNYYRHLNEYINKIIRWDNAGDILLGANPLPERLNDIWCRIVMRKDKDYQEKIQELKNGL